MTDDKARERRMRQVAELLSGPFRFENRQPQEMIFEDNPVHQREHEEYFEESMQFAERFIRHLQNAPCPGQAAAVLQTLGFFAVSLDAAIDIKQAMWMAAHGGVTPGQLPDSQSQPPQVLPEQTGGDIPSSLRDLFRSDGTLNPDF